MWKKKNNNSSRKIEDQRDFVINLSSQEDGEEIYPRKGLTGKSLRFLFKNFFSFFLPRQRSVDFIKKWEEEDMATAGKMKKSKKRKKKTSPFSGKVSPFYFLKKRIKFIFSFFVWRSFNTNQRGFWEATVFLVKIFYVNLKAFLFSLFLFKKIFKGFIKFLGKFFLFFSKVKDLAKKTGGFFSFFTKNKRKEKIIKEKEIKRGKKKEREKKEELTSNQIYHTPRFFLKSLFSFLALILLLILIFKGFSYYKSLNVSELEGRILGVSEKALWDLKQASGAFADLNLEGAGAHFSQASNKFGQAQKELEEINSILLKLSKFAPQKKIKLASVSRPALEAGSLASQLGNNLSLGLDSLLKIDLEGENKEIIERIKEFEEYLEKAEKNTEELNRKLLEIDPEVLPKNYQEDFKNLREKVSNLDVFWQELSSLTQKIKIFLGEKQDRKYLLVFQNSAEMRATGGFIGSFALLEFSRGKLSNIEIPEGGSYDVDGGLNRLIAPPEPLQLVDERWYFRDANWWPDWPTSARKLIWFYENSGGSTVDGVISFTPEVLGSILEITGPLDMREKYGIIFNKDNFWDNIRKSIEEEKKLEDNKPKKVINDLFQEIVDKIPQELSQKKLVNFLSETNDHLEAKNILFYFNQPDLQEEVEKRSWAGRIKETSKDYLAVINTNIAGGKSDRYIKQEINHKAEIQEDGSVVDTLEIIRRDEGSSGQYYYGDRNVNWLRVYVPEGSELIKASGFKKPDEIYFERPSKEWEKDPMLKKEEDFSRLDPESETLIYNEFGKTVFANWTMLDPGEEIRISFKYKLPFKIKKKKIEKDFWDKLREKIGIEDNKQLLPYSLFLQKQPGSGEMKVNSKMRLNSQLETFRSFSENLDINSQGWNINQTIDKDKFWAVLLTNKEK